MRLKNVLIVVSNLERSVKFYKEIFGLQVILDQEANVIMTEGLVLQEAKVWEESLGRELTPKGNMTELYFEEPDLDGFMQKLKKSDFEIEYANRPADDTERKSLRLYDPDGNLIEVGSPINY